LILVLFNYVRIIFKLYDTSDAYSFGLCECDIILLDVCHWLILNLLVLWQGSMLVITMYLCCNILILFMHVLWMCAKWCLYAYKRCTCVCVCLMVVELVGILCLNELLCCDAVRLFDTNISQGGDVVSCAVSMLVVMYFDEFIIYCVV
jgi:hypothetical protein